ncbi:MAG: penicillin-insensitive murein endopeptidase [Myxococcales bacterium]|nr:penicillin-insensitive murein endopeptidase [Myxococcales bacterium]
MRALLVLCLVAAPAIAGTHVVQRGETLEHVAKVYGCSTEALLKANNLNNTLVRAGTVVRVPACTVRARARVRAKADARAGARADAGADASPEAKAEAALAVIDGTAVVKTARAADIVEPDAPDDGPSESIGRPWAGKLMNGDVLPRGEGYQIRRPKRAYGATHVVGHLRRVIAEVRALYPDLHTLAIGDLSAQGGGKIGDHHSHQSGLDVDIGFYFHATPEGYPDRFAPADADLDLQATWALVTAFVRTAPLDTGVQLIFLDYEVQKRLYEFARRRGTPEDDLAAIFQYPRGQDTLVGIVRHWPHHADHLHVRFKPDR